MRAKQLWTYVPLPQSLRLVGDRLTFSRLTTIYFVVALVHCFIQVNLQISALYNNRDATHVLAQIAALDPNTPAGYAILTPNGPLRACTGMPGSTGSTTCRMVWSGKVAPDALGGDSQYSYDESTASTATSPPSTSPAFASVQSSTTPRVFPTVATTSLPIASNIATQTSVTTTQSGLSSPTAKTFGTSVAQSLTTTAPASTSSLVSAGATLVPPGGSSIVPVDPARNKRMYIPAYLPGTKVHTFFKRDLAISPVFSQSNGSFEGIKLHGLVAGNYAGPNQSARAGSDDALISSVCVHALQWPLQRLWNTQREDAVFIGFQFWVLGMSVVALLNESVPHIIAAFLTHLLATGWSAFQLAHTANFRSEFNRLTTRGACGGVNLLPTYWKGRSNAEISILVLNAMVLICSAYTSWNLLKTFGWLTFKRVGASLEINHIYRIVLSLAIVLQLSLYFMIVTMALWIENLYHGPAAKVTSLAPLYKTIVAIQLMALVPWLIMGWYAVRREMRRTMVAFIVLSALFIVAWAGMFASPTWRLTFITWMFFRMISISAVILAVLSLGLGIACFFNFGKGLPKHLRINDDFGSASDFEPARAPLYDPEKVDFPVRNGYPTFSTAFPSRSNSVVSSHSGTRSESAHLRSDSEVSVPPLVIARPPSHRNSEVERPVSTATTNSSVHDPFEHDLVCVMSNNTYPTIRSITGTRSVDTVQDSSRSSIVGIGKRWVIE